MSKNTFLTTSTCKLLVKNVKTKVACQNHESVKILFLVNDFCTIIFMSDAD